MIYQFDSDIAERYGVDEAIMIANLMFWIRKNEANGKHYHDGRYWTYNSIEAFVVLFPFWSKKQIRRILQSLIDKEVIVVGNYNSSTYDRTTWYAFGNSMLLNGKIHVPKWANGNAQMGTPIPDIENTDIENTDKILPPINISPKSVFHKPTLEQIKDFVTLNGYEIDAEQFYNYYESNGWMVGRNKMKSWEAAIRNWVKNEKKYNNNGIYQQQRNDKRREGPVSDWANVKPEDLHF